MSDLVCDREFIVEFDGVERRIVIEWMTPVRDRGDWRCDWVINGLQQGDLRGKSMGVDSAQALLLALAAAGDRLGHEAPTVRWLDGSGGLGLPALSGSGT